MKILRLLIILAVGFILGWAVSNTIAHRNFEKFKSAWDPAHKMAYEESAAFQKTLTKEEMEQMRQDIRDYGKRSVEEIQMMALWQGVFATQIQGLLNAGDTDQVDIVLTRAISKLKEKNAEGVFKGTEYEGIADKLSGVNASTPEEPK
jgi:hypothetical protein